MCLCTTAPSAVKATASAEGQQVEYAVVSGEKGLQAEDVVGL